jgi:hypothetical protein
MGTIKKKLGLVGLVVLAVALFVGASSASAAQWLDNGSAIPLAESTSIVDNHSGLTLVHTGGLAGSRSLNCLVSASGTVVGSGDTSGVVTFHGCLNVLNCTGPTASSVHTPWTTSLVSTTEDDITAGNGGTPGWSATCSGISISCTKATTPIDVSYDTSVTPNRVDGVFTAAHTSAPCSDGGTGTVAGTIWITLTFGNDLSVGP